MTSPIARKNDNSKDCKKKLKHMTLLMIRPVQFGYNPQTAVNNAFQEKGTHGDAQQWALQEFDGFAAALRSHDIDVMVVEDTPEPHTPDSIFPNNWFSAHHDGTLVYYPIFAENRRWERKDTVIEAIRGRFQVAKFVDYTQYEQQNRFLEGTGSLVFDRAHRLAYACVSPRTDPALVALCCADLGYEPIVFEARDRRGTPIYHTNVMMAVADRYAVVNSESIETADRKRVLDTLERTGKAIIEISHAQMDQFAGNMLQVRSRSRKTFLVMSSQAYASLSPAQIETLTALDTIIHAPLDTIERLGGGSARCMLAEIFLPPRHD